MAIKQLGRLAAALVAGGGLISAALVGFAGTASAENYGPGAQYQVEISANPSGEGLWFWAALDTGNTGNYQETDCIHLGGGHATDAAAHDSGDLGWFISGDTLTMTGVSVIGGLETVGISVALGSGPGGTGHGSSVTITYESGIPALSGTFATQTQVQIAP